MMVVMARLIQDRVVEPELPAGREDPVEEQPEDHESHAVAGQSQDVADAALHQGTQAAVRSAEANVRQYRLLNGEQATETGDRRPPTVAL